MRTSGALKTTGFTLVCLGVLLPSSLMAQKGGGRAGESSGHLMVKLTWARPATRPVPVAVDLPENVLSGTGMCLSQLSAGTPTVVPCQTDPDVARRVWCIARPPASGLETTYGLRTDAATSAPAVSAAKGEKSLGVSIGASPVLQYRHAPVPPPVGTSPSYARSGFIHPLWSPGGAVLTTIHPKDHVHHVGIWNPWTSTEFEGRHVDFWNLAAGQGTVRFVEYESVTSGPVFGGFRAVHEHVDLKAPGGEKVALREVWDVRVWNWQAEDGSFLIDFTITQQCATESPLLLNAYRYGGFGFRARADWTDGNYLTSEGRTRTDGHSTRARWCHAYGPTPQGGAGILFMSHPLNREHPEPMRLWPKGHIFFNFCPIQKRPWTLEPGKSYTLRYRLHVYDGQPSADEAQQLWQAFAQPPAVSSAAPR